ncbi:hypothetical protein VC83_00829 [Pseudogymnoascus destructans]|uniref:MARVEL domain-containing protein n=2 Tax=Pseudogymnoascus destructans TaxID=655981 RepID=L8FQB5_PSED2|nr:uncharacterized protein VC83_00829 [Pseudogymnoascus destructans]ELR02734.1 hypothetical protein GMDG_05680 [Pseudogymnoascus destructans 20631-21]OAF62408.1 hypothetical protein VC83_00829 [Pseudogymnoascus destructans]
MGCAFLSPLRVLQLVTASAVLILSSYVAHWYDADTLTASPSQFNFLIFTGVWSLLGIFYLEVVPRRWPRGSHPYAAFALESLTTIFHLSGFIALAVFLSKLLFCRGSVCNAARADVGAASFGFVLWVISTVMVGVEIFKGGFRRQGGGKVEMRGVGTA